METWNLGGAFRLTDFLQQGTVGKAPAKRFLETGQNFACSKQTLPPASPFVRGLRKSVFERKAPTKIHALSASPKAFRKGFPPGGLALDNAVWPCLLPPGRAGAKNRFAYGPLKCA